MIDWKQIDTVLLDMDGTLLDLYFDNYFWKELVPLKYSERQGMSLNEAKQELVPRFKGMEGRLEWYCLDYWSDTLGLDIIGMKAEMASLIAVLPHVTAFLDKLKASPKEVIMVTNAHPDGLALKMEKTQLQHFFDGIVSSHEFGQPKESQVFWHSLHKKRAFNKQTAVLVDDSLPVLHSAKQFGIGHLVSISKPDSRLPLREIADYPAIEDFRGLMDGL